MVHALTFPKGKFLDAKAALAPTCGVFERLQIVRRQCDMMYFLKAMTNSFQTLIPKLYFSKVFFCKVYQADAFSKLCEFISLAQSIYQPQTAISFKRPQIPGVSKRRDVHWPTQRIHQSHSQYGLYLVNFGPFHLWDLW